jgi:anti-anti-sigma factor
MSLQISSEFKNDAAKITLSGELDAGSAGIFREEIEKMAVQGPKRLVLMVKELSFMASAGLRVLIFAKQKLGTEVSIYIINPQEPIVDTLEKTGFHHSVHMAEHYEDNID